MGGLAINFKFTQFGKLFAGQLDQALRASLAGPIAVTAQRLAILLANGTPVGVGDPHMKDGWTVEGDPITGHVQIVNRHPGLLATDMGRRAAWVPIAPLELWVRAKIEPDEKKARGIAFAISRHKSQNATPGQNFIQPILDQNLPVLQESLQRQANRAIIDYFK